ncbi:MAG: CRISPR-associated helicase Cas3' [Clostridiales bacterium]|jgi:CRISPR-associated endonuclease/helicase Cas3|nr:CRISPR-associated helicase Cas3' [Clostridiales bacterium]
MKEFWAKDTGESLKEHVDKVLAHFDSFMSMYGNFFSAKEKEVIRFVCLMHDEGKKNCEFQEKIRKKVMKWHGEIPHGVLSCAFLNESELIRQFGDGDYFIVIYQAIYNHHTRNFDFEQTNVNDYIEKELKNYLKDEMNTELLDVKSHSYGSFDQVNDVSSDYIYKYFRVKGLLNKFDYAASANESEGVYAEGVEIPPCDPTQKVRAFLKNAYNAELNDCQKYMAENKDNNIVVIASTGIGKTEGSLLWAGEAKTFYTLPLKVSIDAIFKRLNKNGYYSNEKAGHLHSDTLNFFIREIGDECHSNSKEIPETSDGFSENKSAFDNATLLRKRAKAFVYPMTVCTVDQLFPFVFKAPGLEILPATLSYSKLIIDEIQAYSPTILAYLVYGLKVITKMGGRFCIMTATLPPFLVESLKKENIPIEEPVFFTSDIERHRLKIIDGDFDYEKIIESAKDKKVLIICNTVKRVQKTYGDIKNLLTDKNLINEENLSLELLHSRFIKEDRAKKEDAFKEAGKKESTKKGIFISTQIVEASLDIDFDELHTEMSSADSLLQRMGRCYRSRKYDKEEANVFVYFNNVYVYYNAIKSVYDKDIYNLSREFLTDYDGKIFTEKEKVKYMESVYDMKNIESTKYYKDFDDALRVVRKFTIGTYNSSEAQKYFRDIRSVMIIPMCFSKLFKEKNIESKLISPSRSEKNEAYGMLRDYAVAISYACYVKNRNNLDITRILDTDYYFADFKYDKEIGLLTDTKEDDEAAYTTKNFL